MILVTLAYVVGWTYVTVDDVMAIKPRFLASMGSCFVNNGAPQSSAMKSFKFSLSFQ